MKSFIHILQNLKITTTHLSTKIEHKTFWFYGYFLFLLDFGICEIWIKKNLTNSKTSPEWGNYRALKK
jgi:hypothetical protein